MDISHSIPNALPVGPLLCILDFEANLKGEITEFGSIICEKQGDAYVEKSSFQALCRLNCGRITFKTKESANGAEVSNFPRVFARHREWLRQNSTNGGMDIMMMTFSPHDLSNMLPFAAEVYGVEIPPIYKRFIDLQWEYQDTYGDPHPFSLDEVLKRFKIARVGQAHRALNDCRDTLNVLNRLVTYGFSLDDCKIMAVQNRVEQWKNRKQRLQKRYRYHFAQAEMDMTLPALPLCMNEVQTSLACEVL